MRSRRRLAAAAFLAATLLVASIAIKTRTKNKTRKMTAGGVRREVVNVSSVYVFDDFPKTAVKTRTILSLHPLNSARC